MSARIRRRPRPKHSLRGSRAPSWIDELDDDTPIEVSMNDQGVLLLTPRPDLVDHHGPREGEDRER